VASNASRREERKRQQNKMDDLIFREGACLIDRLKSKRSHTKATDRRLISSPTIPGSQGAG